MSRRQPLRGVAALAAAATLCVAASDAQAAAQAPQKPNFVFVLTDDLSRNLVPYMRHVEAMQKQGTRFDRYFLTDSLCCPSRSSILTGRYPHSTGVITNVPPDGGFEVFHPVEEKSTFATALQEAGYRTGMMGKYLNGYTPHTVVDGAPQYVPPGWSAWAVAGNGYAGFNYDLLVQRPGGQKRLVHYGSRPRDYMTDVLSRRGQAFIAGAVKAGKPFMLELSTFAPHAPFTPAPRDANKFPNARVPRGPLFNAPQLQGAPAWLSTAPLTPPQINQLDADFRKRAQSVQAVDKLIGDIRAKLRQLRVADNTYIVFTSDNGYHMGQRRLLQGKQTYWDHDVRVPMVVVGPGVPAGATVQRVAANVDLRPTFQELAGAPVGPRVEGRSLAPFLRGQAPASWRNVTLVEHHGPNAAAGDPDAQVPRQGNPPSYTALRFADALYVQYDDPANAPEYYDLKTDPNERRNVYASLTPQRQAELAALLAKLRACSGGASCQEADQGA
jgi:N-acetylglucosamine-6-sulfatase